MAYEDVRAMINRMQSFPHAWKRALRQIATQLYADNADQTDAEIQAAYEANTGVPTVTAGGLQTFSVDVGLTADSGSAQGGTPLTATYNVVTTSGTAGDSVTLPAAAEGLVVWIKNDAAANAIDVFPASGDTIDGGSADAAVSLAAGAGITYLADGATNWTPISAS